MPPMTAAPKAPEYVSMLRRRRPRTIQPVTNAAGMKPMRKPAVGLGHAIAPVVWPAKIGTPAVPSTR